MLTLPHDQVHHMKKHLQSHDGLTLTQYKETYGEDWLYVKKFHHRCGICQDPILFDLESIYCHLSRWVDRTGHEIRGMLNISVSAIIN